VVEAAGAAEDEKNRENQPVLGATGDGRVWLTEEESQLLSELALGASAVAPGKTRREEFDLSHAVRVA
jgi:hypothetical protein